MTEPRTSDLVLDHCTLATPVADGPLAGMDQAALQVTSDAAILVSDGRIVAVGARDDVLPGVDVLSGVDARVSEPGPGGVASRPVRRVDLGGRAVVPGFVDAHTHPVWAGDRAGEFEQRIGGASYVEIAEAGGGIAATVRATRAASTEALVAGALDRFEQMMRAGTTTVEAKTGYGLSAQEELRQLDVLREVARRQPVRVVATFLGAHAVPDDFRGREAAYIDAVVADMLPEVAARNPEAFVDVFCDRGGFDLEQSARVLRAAVELGLRTKVHSDEFENLGCTALAAEIGATSADHLVATTPEEMVALARAGTVAVVLPGTTFGLGSRRFADARGMVGRGVPVALGTDYNPGTCPCPSLPFMMALATRYLRLTPAEALVAATANAAAAVGRAQQAGRLVAGRPADLVVLDSADYRDLSYRFGVNLVAGVMIDGDWVVGLSDRRA